VVDGTDTTQYYSWTQKLYEVVPNITVLGQQTISVGLFFNRQWLDSLPDDLRAIVRNAGWDMAGWQRRYMAGADAFYDDNLRANGATVYYPTADELSAFRAMTADVPQAFYDAYGKDVVDQFVALVADTEAQVEKTSMENPIVRRFQ
jgi:C4-dicarboxylate-binding protein DctP